MTREELIKKIDFYIEDEKKAHKEYEELVDAIVNNYGTCQLSELFDLIMDVRSMSDDEFRHSLILSKLKCMYLNYLI